MSWDAKVLWTEGLFLQPHHFQQSDRHAESLVAGLARRVAPYAWGVSRLEIDMEALKTGQLALRAASGLTPDGTVFRVPEATDHPPALDVPSGTKDCVVHLTVPMRREGAAEVEMTGAELSAARFRPHEIEVADAAGSGKAARIAVGKLRLQFALATDDLSDRLTIPVARIVEVKPDREVVLDAAFVPAALDIRAAPVLAGFVQELTGLLSHRTDALAGRMAQAGSARGAAEIQDFLLLQAVNRALPLMQHLAAVENVHPERLYAALVSLAGDLSTFMAPEKRPPDFPPYRHHDLAATFRPVIRALRGYLSAVLESSAVAIRLEPRKYGISVGVIADRRLISGAGFVLAVSSQAPSETLRRHFPGHSKLGPVEEIRQLVNSALPGIPMRALPVAPRQVPYKADTVYFELDGQSPLWGRMTTSGGIAVHVSGEYPGLEMELWAIRRG